MLNIGRISGIPLKIHWSFGLMILYVAYASYSFELSAQATVGFALMLICLFFFVILHEMGHALAARRYGIKTHDIIISPLGGLARLEDIPAKPSQELVVAFAGPAVNLVLAIVFALILIFGLDTTLFPTDESFELLAQPLEFLKIIFATNVILFVFNLIPAFPMDGGRILRALLATKLDRVLATRIAMWIGRALALLFMYLAVTQQQITAGLIGVFVFIMAGQEYRQVKWIAKSKAHVAEIMRKTFTKIYDYQYYSHIYPQLVQSAEKNFVVWDEMDQIKGALPELYIKDLANQSIEGMQVRDHMSEKVAIIQPQHTIGQVTQMMKEQGVSICLVKTNQIVGVICRQDIESWFRG